MSKATKADFVVLKRVAKQIGGLLDDMSAFEELKAFKPDAGSFPMANWLEGIVQRRVDDIVLQGENLKKVYELISRNLKEIADLLEGQDADNAKDIAIKEIVDEMPKKISKAIGGDSGAKGEGDSDDGKDDDDDKDEGKGKDDDDDKEEGKGKDDDDDKEEGKGKDDDDDKDEGKGKGKEKEQGSNVSKDQKAAQ